MATYRLYETNKGPVRVYDTEIGYVVKRKDGEGPDRLFATEDGLKAYLDSVDADYTAFDCDDDE